MKTFKWFYLVLCFLLCAAAHAEKMTVGESKDWSSEDTYSGPIDVFLDFSSREKARIETKDLCLRALHWDDYQNYVDLFRDPETVEKYARGKPWAEEEVRRIMAIWIERWEFAKDPFSAFAVHLKDAKKTFIGHVILGHGLDEGESELAFLFRPDSWEKGYPQQALTALLYGFAPRLIKEKYLVNLNSLYDPSPLMTIHATSRYDNHQAEKLLLQLGFTKGSSEIIWEALRYHFTISTDELMENYAQLIGQIPEEREISNVPPPILTD